MTKTLIAHLGAHKTATSLVQNYFNTTADHFEEQGLKYLTRNAVSPYISWGDRIVKKGDAFRAYLNGAAQETEAPVLMFSNENALGRPFPRRKGLYPGSEPIVQALRDVTQDFDVKIVYSIRPQVDFLQSYYLQLIHQGGFMTFNQFLDGINLKSISWRPVIESLQNHFGAQNVKVLDFGLIEKGQAAYIKHFLEAAVGPGFQVDEDYAVVHNPSISDRGLQLALRMNPLLKSNETGLVRKFLQANFSNLTEPRPLLVSEDLRKKLKRLYGAEYDALINT